MKRKIYWLKIRWFLLYVTVQEHATLYLQLLWSALAALFS
jgi:hypothetical protein